MSSSMKKLRFGQKPRAKTNPFKPPPVKQTCILCLEEMTTKQKITYTTSVCACKPQIHDACFDQWDTQHPGSCPICRKKGTIFLQSNSNNTTSVPVVSSGSDNWSVIGCIFGCWSVMNCMDALAG